MKRPDIKKIVYDYIFPIEEWFEGYPNRWEDFARPGGLLSQEIEEERVSFYGPSPNPTDPTTYPLEARYPGLDYNKESHRERLSIFDWHITLFRALADLEITPYEIDTIMTHEGTKHAREQYEKQHGITIEDTTSDDVPLWREPYRNRRSSSIQGARVLPAFRFARTRAAAAAAAAEATAAHMRSLDWDTSDGEVEDEFDGDEDSDGDESAETSEYLDIPPRIIAQEEAERIREFRTTLSTRYPREQFPNGPPPLAETFRSEQIISDQIDEGISFTMALSTEDIEEWSKLADEKGLTRICGGRFGGGLWEVPRCITQLMLQLRRQVHVNEMFELMRDPGFQIELAQRVAQRPLHDYVTFKVRPDSSDSSDGNDQSAIGNVHGHGEEDSPGTGVDPEELEWLQERYWQRVRQFRTTRYPQGAPYPLARRYNPRQLRRDEIEESVLFTVIFTRVEAQEWNRHAEEQGHTQILQSTDSGHGLWEVPRRVTQAFYSQEGQLVHVSALINEHDLSEGADRGLCDYMGVAIRPDLTVAELAQRQQRLSVASANEDGEDMGSDNQDGEAQVEEEEEEDDIEMPSSPIRGLAYELMYPDGEEEFHRQSLALLEPTVDERLAQDINEEVRLPFRFTAAELSEWTIHADSRNFQIVGSGIWAFGEWRVPRRVTHAFRVAESGRAALDVVLHPDFYVGQSRNNIWDHLEADLDLPEGEEMDAARLRAFGGSVPIDARAVYGIRHDAEGAHIASILDRERMRSATLLRGTEVRSIDVGGYRQRWFEANTHLVRQEFLDSLPDVDPFRAFGYEREEGRRFFDREAQRQLRRSIIHIRST